MDPPLSQRELEVLRLAADGLTYEEIGAALGIAARTAKEYCDRLRAKLGVEKKRLLGKAARERGLL